MNTMHSMVTSRCGPSRRIAFLWLRMNGMAPAALIIPLLIAAMPVSVSKADAPAPPEKAAIIVYGLKEAPMSVGEKAWILNSEEVPLVDTTDRVMARLAFQAPISVLEKTARGSRIVVSGWLYFPFHKEAKDTEDGRVETPWRGADILEKPDRSTSKTIGTANGNTHFHYLRRLLDQDSHYYQVALEGYLPEDSFTTDYRRTAIPGTIAGRVTRKGNPSGGLEIALVNWRTKPALTDSDGRFLLKEVPPGWHAICWRSQGSNSWTYFMMGGSGRGMLKPGGHLDLGEIDIGE